MTVCVGSEVSSVIPANSFHVIDLRLQRVIQNIPADLSKVIKHRCDPILNYWFLAPERVAVAKWYALRIGLIPVAKALRLISSKRHLTRKGGDLVMLIFVHRCLVKE